MPDTTASGQGPIQARITIKRLFKDCPKPSGWFGCFAHIRGEGDIKVTGTAKGISIIEGLVLDVKMTWNENRQEYNILEMTPVTKTRTAMIAYLSSLKGISRATASHLVLTYGSEVLDLIKTDPDRIKRELKFSDRIMTDLTTGVNVQDEMGKLRQLLPGFSEQLVKRVAAIWEKPIDIIKDDPYRLTEISGISFSKADTVALHLGFDQFHPYRVNHGITHVLDTMSGNDTYLDINNNDQMNQFTGQVERLLSVRFDNPGEMHARLEALSKVTDSPIVIQEQNGQKKLFLSSMYTALDIVASCIRRSIIRNNRMKGQIETQSIMRCVHNYESNHAITLTSEQKQAVITSVTSHMSIISGGPGRGKTTMVDCLAATLKLLMGPNVVLLAPTGRAMNKLRMATNSLYQTMTIDRLICSAKAEQEMMQSFQKGVRRRRNLTNLIEHQYVSLNSPKTTFIIDESSMLDVEKIAVLMDVYPESRYCFVGDIDQLPPIGKGRFLSDLIASGKIPVSYLTTPQRNGGLILENATKIAQGDTDLKWDFMSMPFFPQAADDRPMLDFILDQYNQERQNCPDITDIALLCPVKRGNVGVVSLNRALQDIACPERVGQSVIDQKRNVRVFSQKGHPIQSTIYGDGTSGNWTRFRIGDIVMNTKNQYEIECVTYTNNDFWNGEAETRNIGIFNGDCGRIIGYMPSAMPPEMSLPSPHEFIIVQFFNNSIAMLDVTVGEFESFELGYAMTVHKAQGCEYRTVIYVSPHSLANMKTFGVRNLPYTAVTRAKERVVVIGSKDSINACVSTPLPAYNSDLTERI